VRRAPFVVENVRPPLKEGEHGPYGALAGRALPEGLVLLFMPSLAAILAHAEQLKGALLTEQEVFRIRDAAQVVVTLPQPAAAVEERRGYADVEPANAWESWQAIRGGAR
jgi:hypothetical protein